MDQKKNNIETYVGNNYGFGGNKFDGNFNINLPTSGFNVPSGSSTPNPPTPPSNTDIDTFVGNNYGFGGNKFDGTYGINIGGGQQETPMKENPNKGDKPKTKPKLENPEPCKTNEGGKPSHTAGKSTYKSPGAGMEISCPVCAEIWARHRSMFNYQTLLRGDHVFS